MKVTTEQLTELLWNRLGGGFPNDETNLSIEEVGIAIQIASAYHLKMNWFEKNQVSEFTDTISERSFEATHEELYGHRFIDLSDKGILDLPGHRGVTRLALKDEPFKDLPYISNTNICIKGTIGWILRDDKIYLFPKSEEYHIPCEFIVSLVSLTEIPTELMAQVLEMARGLLTPQPKDNTNNQNAEV